MHHADPAGTSRRSLGRYLNQHLLASEGGLQAFRAGLDTWTGTEHEASLRFLVDDIARDRRDLARLIHRLGLRPAAWKRLLTNAARAVGRLGLANPLRRRDASTAQLELDTLTGMVQAKLSMWDALLECVEVVPGLERAPLEALRARAIRQIEEIQRVSLATCRERFREEPA